MNELRTIDDLKPANYNPRIISAKARNGLKKSLQVFGDIGVIVWNKRSGNLVSGHQRTVLPLAQSRLWFSKSIAALV